MLEMHNKQDPKLTNQLRSMSSRLPAEWLVQDGEMGRLIRARDWSSTPLGPREHWPQSLRTVVNLVVQSAMPMILLWGPELIMLYNDACVEIFADRHPRALGATWHEVWPEIKHLRGRFLYGVMDSGKAVFHQDVLLPLHRRGRVENAYFTIADTPVRVEDGSIGGVFITLHETTAAVERRMELERAYEALRASEQRYAAIFEQSPYAFAMCAVPGGEFAAVNDAFLRTFEFSREELIGKTCLEVGMANPESREQLIAELVRNQRVRNFECIQRTKSGAERLIAMNVDRIQVGDQMYLLVSGEDLTSRRDAEEARQLYERTKELDELKTRFFSSVSHELRTPLALILGPTQQILQNPDMPVDMRNHLGVIDRNAQTLLGYVNNLLDVAKLEAGHLKAEYVETDFARLARLVASLFELVSAERHIHFALQVPDRLVVQVDAEKIQRVLLNLLSNAFHFAPKGGHVRLMLEQIGTRIRLEVADSGPGIPVDRREAVFERFGTLHSGGTGLGLTIAREFTVLHGGSISITDAPEGGALFVVDLPCSAPAGAVVRPEKLDGENSRQSLTIRPTTELRQRPTATRAADALVLVVEDNPEMNRFIVESLSDKYDVDVAFDGNEGLAKALEFKPDLILCDLTMPEMDGETLVHEIRRRPKLAKTPIVVLSAKTDEEARIRLLRDGVQDYLTKPFHIEELRARVTNLIREKRVENEQRILAEFGAALASLDYEKTLHELVEIAVRSFADYAHLYLMQEDGRARRVASACRHQAHAWFAEVLGIMPSDGKTPHPTLRTLEVQSAHLQQFDLETYGLNANGLQEIGMAVPRSFI